MSTVFLVILVVGAAVVGIHYVHNRNRTFFDRFVSPKNRDELATAVLWMKDVLREAGYEDVTTDQAMIFRLVVGGHAVNCKLKTENAIRDCVPKVAQELYREFPLMAGVRTQSVRDICTCLTYSSIPLRGRYAGRADFVRGYFYAFGADNREPVQLLQFLSKCIVELGAGNDDEYYEKIVKIYKRRTEEIKA